MVTHRFSSGQVRGARAQCRGATLLLAALGAATAVQAAGEAGAPGARPLDLSLPRGAGRWTGVASRVQQQEPLDADSGPQPQRTLTVHARSQPYGTGYEARMFPGAAGGALGAAAAGPLAAGPGARRGAGSGAARDARGHTVR